ncbi:helix-turn-helix domain-containing protein [Oceanobacillus sp. GSFE11]|uniref:Helix-turn-helix domain-containing protein n=2 Tax=Oceanobacillus jordanicus TaxID=2867266 RepID=A0AAW5B7N7_9BACI|nr:helix-turn-helix domain-containing protein [Oceanobacillus jordanicus]
MQMQITSKLGQKIISKVAKYTDLDINIMSIDGLIVASTDDSRVGELHTGAVEVLKTHKELIIDQQELTRYPGTKQGVNLPIYHNDKEIGVVGVSGEPHIIYKFTGLIRTAVEVVLEQIHIERQEHYQQRQWNYWLHQLLHPSGFNKEKLEEDATYSLQINYRADWRAVVLFGTIEQDVLTTIKREIQSMDLDTLFILPFLENEIVIAIPGDFTRLEYLCNKLVKLSGNYTRLGVGEEGFGLVGIRNSYVQAKHALAFSERKDRISYSWDWVMERLTLAIDNEQYMLVSSDYESKIRNLESTYLETIDAFLNNNLSIKKTAAFLHIHRNTLLYRLDKVYKKTGLDPRVFNDSCILKIVRTKQICAMIQIN